MKIRTLSAAVAAVGLLGCASQAAAAANGFTLTYQGTLSDGSDATNIFHLGAGASLVGQGISETFIVNYAAGYNDISGAAGIRDFIGGAGFVSSTVTINGVTVSTGSNAGEDTRTDYHIDPNCSGCASSFDVFSEDESDLITPGFLENWTTDALALGRNLNYHPSLAIGPPVFTAADDLEFQGQFLIDHSLFDQTEGHSVFEDKTFGVFAPDSVTISAFGGVPEPAAWALMLIGFGAAGAALRRRLVVC